MIRLFLYTVGVLGLLSGSVGVAYGEDLLSKPSIVVGRTAKVRGAQITLGEIGTVSTGETEDSLLVSKLKGLVIADSPLPGGSIQLMGQRIVDTMSAAQIDLGSVLFSIPPVIFVQREGRTVSSDEVLAVAQQTLCTSVQSGEIKIKSIAWERDQIVPVGQTSIVVESLGEPSAGKMPLRVSVAVDDTQAAKFLATATVDDWRDIPILSKNIERGMLISESDFELVRTNVSELSPDIASSPKDLIGRAAKNRIAAGETVRKSMIDIPPTITKGSKITARYGTGGLVVTASAIAVDDGLKGGEVRLRNESSSKIFKGTVIDERTVEVK